MSIKNERKLDNKTDISTSQQHPNGCDYILFQADIRSQHMSAKKYEKAEKGFYYFRLDSYMRRYDCKSTPATIYTISVIPALPRLLVNTKNNIASIQANELFLKMFDTK